MPLIIHGLWVRSRLHRGLWPAHRIIHRLLSGNTHAFIRVVGPNCMVLVAHEGVWLGDHWDRAAITHLRLILVGVLEKLQAVTNLRLVKTI